MNPNARIGLMTEQRTQIDRLSVSLEALARDAHRRKAATQLNHALEGLDALTEVARTLTQMMKQLHQEITNQTEKETNQ